MEEEGLFDEVRKDFKIVLFLFANTRFFIVPISPTFLRKSVTVPQCNTYRKIPKISPGAYVFQRPFLRGLYSEGLIYGGKFAFQSRLG